VLDLKRAIAAQSDVEAERQRLIYSGRVLKDDDALSVYKIQSSHTIHMVKGAVRSGGESSGAAQPLPTMQAGQNPLDPLTQLNSHRGYGAMAGLNPFADMGVNQNDPNMVSLRVFFFFVGRLSLTSVTDADDDELAAVFAADERDDVESGGYGADYFVEPADGADGPADSCCDAESAV
jgi:hypothetical protein